MFDIELLSSSLPVQCQCVSQYNNSLSKSWFPYFFPPSCIIVIMEVDIVNFYELKTRQTAEHLRMMMMMMKTGRWYKRRHLFTSFKFRLNMSLKEWPFQNVSQCCNCETFVVICQCVSVTQCKARAANTDLVKTKVGVKVAVKVAVKVKDCSDSGRL